MEPAIWFVIVFLVLLKIPAAYLCYVVWWAVKDPPVPGEEEEEDSVDESVEPGGPDAGGSWWRRRARKPLHHGPHGSPTRRPSPALTNARSRERA